MKSKYFNRELSWIEFNARVLHEGTRNDVPLLERFRFLSIAASNFDEFFQVRVAAMKRLAQKENARDASGLTVSQVLKKISSRCHTLLKTIDRTVSDELLPRLDSEGTVYVPKEKYNTAQKAFTDSIFRHEIFPLLTPLRTDTADFPHIGNLKLTAAFLLEPIQGLHLMESALTAKSDEGIVALVQIPVGVESIVWLPAGEGNEPSKKYFTLLDDIILLYGTKLFSGYNIKEAMLFKVARDADFAVNENSGSDFIQAMEEGLIKRQSSFAVRMMCTSTSPVLKAFISSKLSLSDEDIYEVDGILNTDAFLSLADSGDEKLLYPKWKNFHCEEFPSEETIWNTIRQHDVLLNVPYQSYDPVVKFIQEAVKDKNVLAIKMTLYRTGNDSPIVKALKEAAQNGKQVTAFVELKARFDEQRNISWATQLENAGVIVVYGVVGLKVHAKACLVVRRESDGIRRYAHLSTGNYNPKTARQYQDFSIFTCSNDIVNDLTLFFNVISGYSALQTMHHVYMAPVTLKSRLIELIEREISHAKSGNGGMIVAKMNSLCHKEIIDALYRASCAGVKILLNVRGICTLVPGVKDMSENISVVSVVDRYLEHSRVFYFANGLNEELYLSSADWMERNLDRRIELMFPVTDAEVFKQIKESLDLYFEDNTHAYVLHKDGNWKLKTGGTVRAQEVLYKLYRKREELSKVQPDLDFEVRRN